MKNRNSLWRLAFLISSAALVRTHGATFYVSTSGSDGNSGTSSAPFRTITYAYSRVGAGDTIIVLSGLYTDYTSGWGLHLGSSGTSSSPITLKSQVRGGAIIDGQNASDRNVAIYIDGSYNIVDGFEIRNGPNGGITIWSNGNQIRNNEIHNNGNPASASTNGRDGVYSDSTTSGGIYYGNCIHDNGRTGSNLDHGLYLCGDNEQVYNNISIRNAATGLQVAGYTTVSNLRVYNNVIAYNGTSGIILWQALNGVDIKNNLICFNGTWGINSYAATGGGVVVDHDVIYGNGSGSYNFSNGGSTYSYTLGTTIQSDPQLVNETSSGFDAHLTSGSPAIGAGLNLSSYFTTDLAGAARPSSGAWDLGAYIYGSGTTDTTPPTVNITSPANGATVSGTVTVSANASDDTSVASVQFQLDGSNLGSAQTAGPYQVSWNTANSANGSHTLAAIARDPAGNQAKASISVTVNNLAPVVTLTSPANGSSYAAPATISLTASVTANGHMITSVLFFNGSTLLGSATTAPYSFAWNNVSAGSYTLSAKALYDAGSTVSSGSVGVTVISAAPPPSTNLTFAATSGAITAPFAVNANGAISQPSYTGTPGSGGQAVYTFSIVTAGNYVVSALVIAPTTDNNSFFVNIDGQPTSPTMIWDVPVVTTLASETVTWRGNGVADSTSPSGFDAQYSPAVFNLSVGAHQLIIQGREANTQLGQITIAPYGATPPPSTPPSITLTAPANGSSYTAPANINLAARVAANAHTITSVQFYNGSTLLGAATAAPYSFAWNNVSAGSYTLSAAAVYDAGSTVTSGSVSVSVAAATPPPSSGLTFAATSGVISGAFTVTPSGTIVQPSYTGTPGAGGQAVYTFSIATAGNYVVSALVIAPTTDNNSFFVNIDGQPTSPTMIWDVPVVTTLTSETVTWRGNGVADSTSPSGFDAQYSPAVFNLSVGAHHLIIQGREGNTQLGQITISPQ